MQILYVEHKSNISLASVEAKNHDIVFNMICFLIYPKDLDFFFSFTCILSWPTFLGKAYIYPSYLHFPLCFDLSSRLLSKDSAILGNTLERERVVNACQ